MGLVPKGLVSAYKCGHTIVLRIPFWAYYIFAFEDHVDPILEPDRKALILVPRSGSGLLKLVRRKGEPNSAYVMIGKLLRALGISPWNSGTKYFKACIRSFMGKDVLEVFLGEEVDRDGLYTEEAEEGK